MVLRTTLSGFPKAPLSRPTAISATTPSKSTLICLGASVYGGNTSDATSSDGADSISRHRVLHLLLTSPVTVVLTPFTFLASVLGGSSVFGGQGNDSIDAATTVSASYLTGNLGNDTIDVGGVLLRAQPSLVVAVSCSTPPLMVLIP